MLINTLNPLAPDKLVDKGRAGANLAKPTPGRSLGAAVLTSQKPFLDCIAELRNAAKPSSDATRILEKGSHVSGGAIIEPADQRLCWFVVNVALLHGFAKKTQPNLLYLPQSLLWFFGDESLAQRIHECFPEEAVARAQKHLALLPENRALLDVYPYLVEPHGHVSRSSLKQKSAIEKRIAKKASGVYYTPGDVADFMVDSLVTRGNVSGAWIDPACGTGVFLRAILFNARRRGVCKEGRSLEYIKNYIYGIDRSALSIDCCAFILLAEVATADKLCLTPYSAFVDIKGNLACMDSLSLEPGSAAEDLFSQNAISKPLEDLFPQSSIVPIKLLIMNPPYATTRIEATTNLGWLQDAGKVKVQNKLDLHLVFTEMMWRLTGVESAAAVLPLSLAANSSQHYLRTRQQFLASDGRKEMLFFDREPQALFGEDIKTRNAIFFRFSRQDESTYSSSLLKWTAQQRPNIFTLNRLVKIDGASLSKTIPKVGSTSEALVHKLMSGAAPRATVAYVRRTPLVKLLESEDHAKTICVGATAYNFLNIFVANDIEADIQAENVSESPVASVSFDGNISIDAAFAILSSRVAYWLWRVEGDGFHVTSEFLRSLPLWAVLDSKDACVALILEGRKIRDAALNSAVRSVNAGKVTYSFHCSFDHPSIAAVERIIFSAFNIPSDFSISLDKALHAAISIDGSSRRSHQKLLQSKL